MRKFFAIAAVLSLAGCSSTPTELEKQPSSLTETRTYPDNYQALYRKVHGPASRCLAGSVGNSTQMMLDAQLYPDLGFGEMTYSMASAFGRNFYAKAKIEKAGEGSKMTVVSGNTVANGKNAARFFGWAEGGEGC
ncbi:hypothetical protein [Endobacterium cereale]|uniref:hypothetical protein n=1 Tax=Endobacterium cereale TaxID=2663029 RepID=UPI002B499503|nr:hypothetical protein [Endobacterium cereale]MEB2845962.1 hypothetical protein [Endobacterium cereale]